MSTSYCYGTTHERWFGLQETDQGQLVESWSYLQATLIIRFETLNKIKISRDILERCKTINVMLSSDKDLEKLLLGSPTITMEEQIILVQRQIHHLK